MTTATYHSSGLGQDVWGQSIHPGGSLFAQQYGQPIGSQAFLPQQYAQQQFVPQQPFGQSQFVSQQPFGPQILAVLPALIAQQAQQLYAIAQMCTQVASGSGYQVGVPQTGQRPYSMGL